MASDEQRARRRAQRQLAANRKAGRPMVQPEITQTIHKARGSKRSSYADRVLAGDLPEPPEGSENAKILASEASYASKGKRPVVYETAFKKFWYKEPHKRRRQQ